MSEDGKQAGYWEKPLLGKSRVPGAAYVIGTYTFLILGCPLAGLLEPSAGSPPVVLPDAESLVAYYLEFPAVKARMEAHFRDSDDYARRNLSPEMLSIMSDTKTMLMTHGMGRGDENILTVYWELTRHGKYSVSDGIDALTTYFMYGASLDAGEVERLWGVQAQTTVVPVMDRPLTDVRAETIAEIRELTNR